LTAAEQRSEAESVRDEAGGLHGTTENTGQRSLVKDRDMLNGDSDSA
jgi:hypothetical protein